MGRGLEDGGPAVISVVPPAFPEPPTQHCVLFHVSSGAWYKGGGLGCVKDEWPSADVFSVPGLSSALGLRRQTGWNHWPQGAPRATQGQDTDPLASLCPG